jgi:L,D-transpeptidase catalytic domain
MTRSVLKGSVQYPISMKKSVSRLIAVTAVLCAPLVMSSSRAPLPKDGLPLDKVVRMTPGLSGLPSSLNFTDRIYAFSHLEQLGFSHQVLDLALKGFDNMTRKGLLSGDSILSIIDFTRSSRERRFVVIDLRSMSVLFNTVVAHGKNTGGEFARRFSNRRSSNKSSIGFYVTREPYIGSNGYSLKLEGLDRGFNDNAMRRAIVMHPADYANEEAINRKGYLGRSWGCPALPEKQSHDVIETIKNGNLLFLYYPDKKYLSKSQVLNS